MSFHLVINGVAVVTDTVEDAVAFVRCLSAAPVHEKPKTLHAAPADLVPPASKPLICRKPLGCGKAFESENRMAWYCPPCTAKRDEGRSA